MSVLLYKLFSGAVMTSLGYFIEHWYKPFIVKTINIMMVDPELMNNDRANQRHLFRLKN